jgi:hypothetical protein
VPTARRAGDALIRRSRANLWRAGDFGVVVLGPSADDPVTLDGTAVAVWEALAVPTSRDDLVAGLAHRFGADAARVAADVEPLLDRLDALGVVEIES